MDALWLSELGCELGFSIGINAVNIGFFLGRRILQLAAGLRSLANDWSCVTVVASLALIGALLGGLALWGLFVLASLGQAAQFLLSAAHPLCWPAAGALLLVGLCVLTLLPSEAPYFKVLRFLEETLWFADAVTWASLTCSRKTTHVSLRAAWEALGVLGHVSIGTALRVVRDSAAGALLSPSMVAYIGVVASMFSEYCGHIAEEVRLPELSTAVAALARLQAVAGRAPKGRSRPLEDVDGGTDVQRFVWFALGMHGHAGLKFLGAIDYGSVGSDLEALAYCASITPADVLLSEWRGQLHIPGYALAVDRASNSVVLAIRGSLWPQDWVTDFDCRPRPFELDGQRGFAHSGMLTAAENLSAALAPVVGSLLRSAPYRDIRLVLTGHSLGAGVAALLAALWSGPHSPLGADVEARLSCVAYGMPAVVSPHLGRGLRSRVTAVVCAHDFVPRFSLCSSMRFRDAALRLWRRPGAAAALLEAHQTIDREGSGAEESARVAARELEVLMEGEAGDGLVEGALCPLGRVLWAPPTGCGGGVVEVEEPGKFFRDLPLGSTKDIFEPHLPQNYAARFGGGAGPVPAAAP